MEQIVDITAAGQLAPIVAGYDGSPSSLGAVRWAAAEAARLLAPLRIVEAFEFVITTRPPDGHVVPLDALRSVRQRGLDAVAETICLEYPGLIVDTHLTAGPAVSALLEAAVLGSRGLGGWSGLLVGSVAVQVTTHAPCPVVVMAAEPRGHEGTRRTVVVGVDGSATCAKAIAFAFEQAQALGARVVALHAWHAPALIPTGGGLVPQIDPRQLEDEARLLVAESIAGAAADHPDVECTTVLTTGSAAQALVHKTESADLVVVGSRGRGGFTQLLLGSVGQSVLHHARCPVAVVR
jgi:nucleotide-binding universal stress UspA family protein